MAEVRDPHLHVTFFLQGRPDPKASREAGRPMFRDVEMCRIRFSGDRKKELVAPAHEPFQMRREDGQHMTYAERYPDHYAAFLKNKADAITGTPVSMLPGLTPSKVRELEASNIVTVEALAALPDRVIGKMGMGARELVERAKGFLDNARDNAATDAIRAENAELRERMARLEAMLSAPAAELQTGPETMTTDELRAYLDERGVTPRANASREKLIEAVVALMADDEQVAA